MNPQTWRDFICSPDRAGRHLSSIGKGVTGGMADAMDLATLEDFLRKLSGPEDVLVLSDAVDLLTGPYAPFMKRTLPDLVEAMSNEVMSKQSVVGPGLRGNPIWGKTILGRLAGHLSPVHYYARTSHRSYDLPENRLLRWLVSDVEAAVNRILRRVQAKALHPELLAMLTSCNAALRHHAFGDIPVPGELAPQIEKAGRLHRRREYRDAAALASRRSALDPDDEEQWWNNVLSLLATGWLQPIESDRLFELYVMVLVMDTLGEELGFGDPVEIGLVTTKRRHVALYQRHEVTIRLYFNQTPATILGCECRYGEVVANHVGLAGQPRRPDVLLVVEHPGKRTLVIIEAKETGDRDYLSESVYKVFGYLYDFAQIFKDEGGIKAILIVPEGITSDPHEHAKIMRVVSGDRRNDVATAIGVAIGR